MPSRKVPGIIFLRNTPAFEAILRDIKVRAGSSCLPSDSAWQCFFHAGRGLPWTCCPLFFGVKQPAANYFNMGSKSGPVSRQLLLGGLGFVVWMFELWLLLGSIGKVASRTSHPTTQPPIFRYHESVVWGLELPVLRSHPLSNTSNHLLKLKFRWEVARVGLECCR